MEATEMEQHEIAEIEEFANKRDSMLGEIRKVIVGQDHVIEEVLIALFARRHCLLVGVPGLAKTLLISTLAEILDLDFNRVQFTPDLMPSDITGTDILQEDAATGRRAFQFLRGPIFTNILLADEINRTPPKTQAALLQSMQEYKVTAGGTTFPLDLPFFVLATQNPIEQEGTYPLPEAQLDRFMVNVEIGYPDFEDEVQIVMQTTSTGKPSPHKIMDGPAILHYQELVRKVPVMQNRRAVHYLVRRRFAGRRCLHNDLHFVFKIRIADLHVHHKAIELGFRKRIGAFLLDGVLGGQDEKRQGKRERGAAGGGFVFP